MCNFQAISLNTNCFPSSLLAPSRQLGNSNNQGSPLGLRKGNHMINMAELSQHTYQFGSLNDFMQLHCLQAKNYLPTSCFFKLIYKKERSFYLTLLYFAVSVINLCLHPNTQLHSLGLSLTSQASCFPFLRSESQKTTSNFEVIMGIPCPLIFVNSEFLRVQCTGQITMLYFRTVNLQSKLHIYDHTLKYESVLGCLT